MDADAEADVSYFPLDRDILTSSIWAMGTPEQFKVWSYLLLAANPRTGIVVDTAPAIALRCGLPLDVTLAALDWLASPDTHSRTKVDEGRRIRTVDGGYQLVTYMQHQAKDHSTARVQRFRAKRRNAVSSVSETPGNARNDGHGNGQGQERMTEEPSVINRPDVIREINELATAQAKAEGIAVADVIERASSYERDGKVIPGSINLARMSDGRLWRTLQDLRPSKGADHA